MRKIKIFSVGILIALALVFNAEASPPLLSQKEKVEKYLNTLVKDGETIKDITILPNFPASPDEKPAIILVRYSNETKTEKTIISMSLHLDGNEEIISSDLTSVIHVKRDEHGNKKMIIQHKSPVISSKMQGG